MMDDKKTVEAFIEKILGFSKPRKVDKIEEKLESNHVNIYLDYPRGTKFKYPV